MTKREQDSFRKTLQMKEMEVLRELHRRRPSIHIEPAADTTDRLSQNAEIEFNIRAIDRHSALLNDIRAALRSLETSAFGVCFACGEQIAPKRLRAVPWTRYCLSCQSEAEARMGRNGEDLALAS